jgi:hypothetical protein
MNRVDFDARLEELLTEQETLLSRVLEMSDEL